jgi:hypothetical protein
MHGANMKIVYRGVRLWLPEWCVQIETVVNKEGQIQGVPLAEAELEFGSYLCFEDFDIMINEFHRVYL